jgi:hypothetical protein
MLNLGSARGERGRGQGCHSFNRGSTNGGNNASAAFCSYLLGRIMGEDLLIEDVVIPCYRRYVCGYDV